MIELKYDTNDNDNDNNNENVNNYKDHIDFDNLARDYFNSAQESIDKIKISNKEEFFTISQKAFFSKNYAEIYSNKVYGCIKFPKMGDLNCKRMIGLKRGNKSYLLIDKINKVKDEINKGKIKHKQIKNEIQEGKENQNEDI